MAGAAAGYRYSTGEKGRVRAVERYLCGYHAGRFALHHELRPDLWPAEDAAA